MLATLVQRVTTVSNVQLCVVNRKREGDYADESSNIFDYIPFTFILSKRSSKNPTKTKPEMYSYHADGDMDPDHMGHSYCLKYTDIHGKLS
jgi:hypothetical protein